MQTQSTAKKPQKVGMVLEGGGMRGVFTSGALDCLLDEKIEINYVVGVSAGACNGVSYVSKQRGRSLDVNTKYISDKRYVSLSNFLQTKSIFGMDFIFNEITYNLEPMDFEALLSSKCDFQVGATEVSTGKAVYFPKDCLNHDSTILRASSSIPLFSPVVEYKGKGYLDGGTSDPIPVRKAISDGCDKLIIVLTKERGFIRQPEKLKELYSRIYKKYPAMIELLNHRHEVYNNSVAYAYELAKEGKAIIICPKAPLGIGRFEKRKEKLLAAYDIGYHIMSERINEIRKWL